MKTKILALVLCLAPAAPAADFYVSPTGSDSNPGTAERPFATLARARDAVRSLKAEGPLTEPVQVNIADGTYWVSGPLVLSPADGGNKRLP